MTAELACVELVELVTEYLEEQLTPQERDEVEHHLASCGKCRAYLEQMRTTIRLTGTLRRDDVPAAVLDPILRAYRRELGHTEA